MEYRLEPREVPKVKSFSRITSSKPLQTPLKQCLENQAGGEHELVKYMSKLPVFLERAETSQDRLLSVGVLDWGRLEKWQNSHNRIPRKSRLPSVSQTDASLAPLRDESSAGPSKVHTRSSACRRKHHNTRDLRDLRPSHTMSSHVGEGSQVAKSVEEAIKNSKGTRKKKPKDHRSIPDEQLGPNTATVQSDGCENNDLKGKICPKTGTLSNEPNPEVDLNMRVKSKVDRSKCRKNKNLHKVNRNTKAASADPDPNKVSVELSQSVPLSTKSSGTPSRGKIREDRTSALLSSRHSMDDPAQRQDSNFHKVASEKVRSISPFQRLSFSIGKTSKTNSEEVAVPTTKLDSTATSTKINSQNVTVSSSLDDSDCNKSGGNDTTTKSHLRRLLEPLLKSRATHSSNSPEGPKGQGVQRVKLGITGCKSVNVNDSAHEKKLASSMVRAHLRVTVKHNQPLFTFTVNKENDIIAATHKKIGSSEEGECTSVYTFLSIKDHKKNTAWKNQKSRDQSHSITSNVVAQMRVSSSLPSGSIREFVLFSVELTQDTEEKSDLRLKNELAAIIVKMPRWFHRKQSSNTVQDHNVVNYVGEKVLEDRIKDRAFPAHLDQDISATVILQSGVHSMPHKGGPSSLIQRWRTGGSCDCGGWDMGCNLRILTNQHNLSGKNSTTSNSPSSSNRLELLFLGEESEGRPFLSFIPIKEGIYSVGYNTSLTQLQAFAICIALAEGRKMTEITLDHKSYFDEHRASGETMLVPDQDSKPGSVDGEAAARYVEYQPPLSPVGRV